MDAGRIVAVTAAYIHS